MKDAGKVDRRLRAARFAALALLLLPASLAAAESGEVWLISTRCAPLCGDLETGRTAIEFWRWSAGDSWLPANAADFVRSGQAAAPTTIFIHGDRTDSDLAVEHGWLLYGHMEEAAQGKPFRLVIWSWPADRIARRPRSDAQQKADFSDVQAYYLARFLGDMRADVPVCLVGYSFGARTATGALEVLAGGSIAGQTLPATGPAPRTFRLVLLAAAADADCLLPGHRDGRALSLVERMLTTENCGDRALKWYSRLYGRRGPDALGYVGPLCCGQPGSCEKIELVDVSCSVGKHDWSLYEAAPDVRTGSAGTCSSSRKGHGRRSSQR